jgi:hypothetical protein
LIFFYTIHQSLHLILDKLYAASYLNFERRWHGLNYLTKCFLFGWSNEVPKRGYQLLNEHLRSRLNLAQTIVSVGFSPVRSGAESNIPQDGMTRHGLRHLLLHETATPKEGSRDADTDTIPTPSSASRPFISCPSPDSLLFSPPFSSAQLFLGFGAAHSIASVPSPSLFPPLPGSIMDQEST